jgi:uroporphyrin-3 C-methyltransferase
VKKEKTSGAQKNTGEEVDCTILNSSSTESNSTSAKKKKTPDAHLVTSYRFGIVTLILATMGIILSIDSLIKVKEWHSGLTTLQEEMETHFHTEQQRLNNLEISLQTIGSQQKTFEHQLSGYHSTLSALKPLLQKRTQQQESVDVLWQLEKAYDWLQEAKLDLRWSNDWRGALVLLQSANAVIEKINVPNLESVHLLLEENIKTLSMIQPLDEVALLEKVKSMSTAVNNLPSPSSLSTSSSAATHDERTKSESTSGWRAVLNRGFDWVKNVVVIKPVDSTTSLPRFQSRRVLNENLTIALQQVQWALLKKDNTLFHWSLEQVSQMINNSGLLIDLNNEETSMFLQNLNFLQKQNLNPSSLPDLQPACQELKAYMDTLNINLSDKVKV